MHRVQHPHSFEPAIGYWKSLREWWWVPCFVCKRKGKRCVRWSCMGWSPFSFSFLSYCVTKPRKARCLSCCMVARRQINVYMKHINKHTDGLLCVLINNQDEYGSCPSAISYIIDILQCVEVRNRITLLMRNAVLNMKVTSCHDIW